jgi:hypothetical protein
VLPPLPPTQTGGTFAGGSASTASTGFSVGLFESSIRSQGKAPDIFGKRPSSGPDIPHQMPVAPCGKRLAERLFPSNQSWLLCYLKIACEHLIKEFSDKDTHFSPQSTTLLHFFLNLTLFIDLRLFLRCPNHKKKGGIALFWQKCVIFQRNVLLLHREWHQLLKNGYS